MAERTNPLRNIQFVLRPGPRELKILFIVLILACTAALAALGLVRSRIQQQTQAALDQAAVLERENAELSQMDGELDASDIRQIAKEELGLVDPDTIILDPIS